MKKMTFLLLLLVLAVPVEILSGLYGASPAQAGSVQFSTYYPAPFGMYDRLRLVPRAAIATACDASTLGTLYVEENTGALTYCNISGAWGPLAGGPWTQDVNGVYVTDTAANVGIGTTSPAAKLHIAGGFFHVNNNAVTGFSVRHDAAPFPNVFRVGGLGNPNITTNWSMGTDTQYSASYPSWEISLRSNGSDEIRFQRRPAGAGNSPAEFMRIDASGKVGIGTTAPNNLLQVAGLINFDDARFSTSLGRSAGSVNTGNYNSFFGYQAGLVNDTGNNNTATGSSALTSNTSGGGNTANGSYALSSNTTGSRNTAIGPAALRLNTSGWWNTAIGPDALFANATGNNNTATGAAALSNTTGNNNTATGAAALSNTTGNNNIAVGYAAGDNITTGSKNIIIGADIDAPSATASNQLSIGNLIFGTGLDGTGTTISTGNIGIGTTTPSSKLHIKGNTNSTQFIIQANSTQSNVNPLFQLRNSAGTPLLSIHSDDPSNTFVGWNAGRVNTGTINTFVGSGAGESNTNGDYNTAVGYGALVYNVGGDSNTAVGDSALESNLTGTFNAAYGAEALVGHESGDYNTAVGGAALYSNRTGTSNVAVGNVAFYSNTTGNENTAIGRRAGETNITGSGNVFIGFEAGMNELGSDKLYIANSSANPPLIYGDFSTGNVGIGTTSPSAKLHVNGNIKAVLNNVPGSGMEYNAGTDEIGFDVAELFETSEEVEAGDVLVIDEGAAIRLKKSRVPYDTKVAGVVSGAPAILFEGGQLQIAPAPGGSGKGTKPPVALTGRVLCKVSAENGAIRPGDLLTSSSVPGHAMKATEREKSFGAIIGKALEPFTEGPGKETEGRIMILMSLR